MMVDCNCGEIPVVESQKSKTPVGVITDRDITCRVVAKGKNPVQMTAKDCMSKPPVTVRPDLDVEDCCELMEKKQIRRVLVTDITGECCGILSQADLAKRCPEHETAHFLKEISGPIGIPSMAGAPLK
jgi:CBS domain-containing protein